MRDVGETFGGSVASLQGSVTDYLDAGCLQGAYQRSGMERSCSAQCLDSGNPSGLDLVIAAAGYTRF